MAGKSRGAALTIFALLFVLLAISDFSKPLSQSPGVGFVFLGTRLTGTGNAIMGPLFGFLLLIYAYGIWTMRRYALPVAYIYTGVGSREHGSVYHEAPQRAAAFDRRCDCLDRNRHWHSARDGDHSVAPSSRSDLSDRKPRCQKNRAARL